MKNQLAIITPKPVKTVVAQAVEVVTERQAIFAISRNPIAVDIIPEDFSVVPNGATLESLIPDELKGHPMVCIINGVFISKEEWNTLARPGEIIIFQAIPLGGGGGGSNPLRVLLTLAVMYVAVQSGGALGGFLSGGALSGSAAQALGGFVINSLGSLAINALVPLPSRPVGSDVATASPTYSVSFQGNSARVEQPIPVGYGIQLSYPDFAAQPYVEYIGNEQYYHAILCIGKGQYNILSTRIDDTDIRTFKDVTTLVIGPGQADGTTVDGQSLIDSSIVTATEVAGQELTDTSWVGAFAVCRSGFTVNQIQLDLLWPRGLGNIGETGGISNRSCSYEIQYRQIDDSDTELSTWITLGSETATFGTATPQSITKKYNVAVGRYQVRIRRTTVHVDDSRTLNDMSWIGLRGRVSESGIKDTGSTFLCVRVRASKQLSGSSHRKFAVLWQRLLPVWNGIAWTMQETRNPAWAIADIWRNTEYGRGLPDSRIDLETLSSLAATWDARQDRFDFIFDSRTTVFEAAQLAARAGRAIPLVRRGRYTVVRDEPQSMPVAMYTPRNIQKGSLSVEFAMPNEEMPDALRLKYRSGKFWDERSVIAQMHEGTVYVYRENAATVGPVSGTTRKDLGLNDGLTFPENFPTPSKIQEISLPGVIGEKQAMREAAFIIGSGYYRRQTVSFSTDLEGLLPSYGSLILVSHDMMRWGQSGEIIAFDPLTKIARTSISLQWQDGATHRARFASPSGDVSAEIQVTKVVDEFGPGFALASLPAFDILAGDEERENTRFSFGDSVTVSENVRVKGLRPKSSGQVDVLGVVDGLEDGGGTIDSHWLPSDGLAQDAIVFGTPSVSNTTLKTISSVVYFYDVTNVNQYGPEPTIPLPNGGTWVRQSPSHSWHYKIPANVPPLSGSSTAYATSPILTEFANFWVVQANEGDTRAITYSLDPNSPGIGVTDGVDPIGKNTFWVLNDWDPSTGYSDVSDLYTPNMIVETSIQTFPNQTFNTLADFSVGDDGYKFPRVKVTTGGRLLTYVVGSNNLDELYTVTGNESSLGGVIASQENWDGKWIQEAPVTSIDAYAYDMKLEVFDITLMSAPGTASDTQLNLHGLNSTYAYAVVGCPLDTWIPMSNDVTFGLTPPSPGNTIIEAVLVLSFRERANPTGNSSSRKIRLYAGTSQ